jgi:hypothetical protein
LYDWIVQLTGKEIEQMEKMTIEIDRREAHLLTAGVSLLLQMVSDDIAEWKNKNDESMDKLFVMMEMYAGAGEVWAKLQEAQGTTREEIAQYLAEQEN